MDYFDSIRRMYRQGLFCDLKLVTRAPDDGTEPADAILCHALVLCFAIPELKPCLLAHQSLEDGVITLILENTARDVVQGVVDQIYDEIVTPTECSDRPKPTWGHSLGLDPVQAAPEVKVEAKPAAGTKRPLEPPLDVSKVLKVEMKNEVNHEAEDSDDEEDEEKEKAVTIVKSEPEEQKLAIKEPPHEDETEKDCPSCQTTLPYSNPKDRADFEKHSLTHLKCSCNIAFESRKSYQDHMKSTHEDKKLYK